MSVEPHVQQPNRVLGRRGAQVHVALRRGEIRVSGQLLDRASRRSFHRQMRTEGMPEHVDACRVQPRDTLRSTGLFLTLFPLAAYETASRKGSAGCRSRSQWTDRGSGVSNRTEWSNAGYGLGVRVNGDDETVPARFTAPPSRM